MASQRDVKDRISSVKNIEKITRAMEMVAAARLRRAEQRISALRPYASAIRRVTRLAAAFNSQIIRAGLRAAAEHEGEGRALQWYASGRRGVSTLRFRKRDPAGAYVGFTDRPQYANAREIAEDLITAYVDGEVDRVEIFYNGYVSALTQTVRRETLLPLQQA